MSFRFYLIQQLFGLLIFTMPGTVLLYYANRRRMPSWPPAFTLSSSFILSSVLIAGFQMLSLTLTSIDPMFSRLAAWLFVGTVLLYTYKASWQRMLEIFHQVDLWEKRAILLVATLMLLWVLLLPLSPYPGQLTVSLGDVPIYYRLAANLANGRGWLQDYFIGDSLNGTYGYIQTYPIPTLITTLFFQIFGIDGYSLHLYNIIAAGLTLYLLVSFVSSDTKLCSQRGKKVFFFTVLISLMPIYFVFFGLGTHTVAGALEFLTLVVFSASDITSGIPRNIVIGITLLFMLRFRPETAMLAVLSLVIYGGNKLLIISKIPRFFQTIFLCGCLAGLFAIWVNLPTLIDRLPSEWKTFYFNFLEFDSETNRFVPIYDCWKAINHEFSNYVYFSYDCSPNVNYALSYINFSNNHSLEAFATHPVPVLIKTIGGLSPITPPPLLWQCGGSFC